jgi:hypothetical protein
LQIRGPQAGRRRAFQKAGWKAGSQAKSLPHKRRVERDFNVKTSQLHRGITTKTPQIHGENKVFLW